MLTKEDVKRISEDLKRPKDPVPIVPQGCTCSWSADAQLGADKYLVQTNPRCAIHGWKLPEDEEWHSI